MKQCVDVFGQLQQRRTLDQIYLVQDQKDGLRQIGQTGDDGFGFLIDAFTRIEHQRNRIGITCPAPGRGYHRAFQPALRRKNTRRIDKDDLRIIFQRDATHLRAGCLNLARDDRNLCPH